MRTHRIMSPMTQLSILLLLMCRACQGISRPRPFSTFNSNREAASFLKTLDVPRGGDLGSLDAKTCAEGLFLFTISEALLAFWMGPMVTILREIFGLEKSRPGKLSYEYLRHGLGESAVTISFALRYSSDISWAIPEAIAFAMSLRFSIKLLRFLIGTFMAKIPLRSSVYIIFDLVYTFLLTQSMELFMDNPALNWTDMGKVSGIFLGIQGMLLIAKPDLIMPKKYSVNGNRRRGPRWRRLPPRPRLPKVRRSPQPSSQAQPKQSQKQHSPGGSEPSSSGSNSITQTFNVSSTVPYSMEPTYGMPILEDPLEVKVTRLEGSYMALSGLVVGLLALGINPIQVAGYSAVAYIPIMFQWADVIQTKTGFAMPVALGTSVVGLLLAGVIVGTLNE